MKKTLIALLGLIAAIAVSGRTLVVDADGEPMAGAVVMSGSGAPVGIVDDNGQLPQLSGSLYPLTLSCIGFERATVVAPTDTIVMTPSTSALGEVVVSQEGRPAMYVVCYVREVSTTTDGTDSITIKSQYMADYMLPAFKGAKSPKWEMPRVLSETVEVRSFDPRFSLDDYPLKNVFRTLASISKNPVELPDELRGKEKGSFTLAGKRGSQKVFRLTPTSLSRVIDGLANREDHTFKLPGIFSILGFSLAITECWEQSLYSLSDNGVYDASNLTAKAFTFKMICEGKAMKSIFPSGKLPVTVYSYVEVYPVEVRYLTKDEAKELKKERPDRKIEVPEVAKQGL